MKKGNQNDERIRKKSKDSINPVKSKVIQTDPRNRYRRYRLSIVDTQSDASILALTLTKREKSTLSDYILRELGNNNELYT